MAQNIATLSLSKNGLYLINEERIFFAGENKSYLLEEIEIPRWVDILTENSVFSLKNNLLEAQQIMDYHKRATLQLIESFEFDDKVGIMLEYEQKFGSLLLTESVDLMEGWLRSAWDWTKNKVVEKAKQFGQFGLKTGKDFIQCITKGDCAPLFEDFREMLFSPIGIAIETFLTVTGIGSPGPMIVWGIMLLWDVSLLISGHPNFSWWNIIFDILGIGFGALAKGARTLVGGAKAVAKNAGKSLTEIVADGMKNPQMAPILTKFKGYAEKHLPTIMGWLTQAGNFMSKKLGIKWAGSVINKVSEVIAKVLEAFGVVAKKGTTAQGVASGLKMGAITQGVMSGTGAISKKRETGLLNSLRTAGPAEYVDGVDF
jgi:hypothetical protein